MADKPEALRLADDLQQQAIWERKFGPSHLRDLLGQAEAELRRLHAVNQELLEALKFYAAMMGRRKSDGEPFYMHALDLDCGDRARATIAKTEGQQ